MYNAEGGAIYGLAGTLFRRRFAATLAGVSQSDLAGGSVNPGPGVPMVLMSGVTAAQALLKDSGVAFEEGTLGPPVEPDGFGSAPKACAPAATQAALAGV